MAGAGGAGRKTIDAGAVQRLQQRPWPGNVRELRNAVERLLILSTGKTITAGDVQRLLGGGAPGEPTAVAAPPADTYEEYMSGAERAFITAKLEQYDWNVTETARALQMPRSNLYKRIMRYGLERETSPNE